MKKYLLLVLLALVSPLGLLADKTEGNAKFQEFMLRAEAGDDKAQVAVANRYSRGMDGVSVNMDGALKWFIRAARQGHVVAQSAAGTRLVEKGELIEGYQWLALAAQQGNVKALQRLLKVKQQMSTNALAEAKRRVAAFKPISEITFRKDTSASPPPLDPTIPLPILKQVTVGNVSFDPHMPPEGMKLIPVMGIITGKNVEGSIIHRTAVRILEARGIKTPGGDYLVMFPEGDHYANNKGLTQKNNKLLAYRSNDKGRTWQGPREAFNIDYSQHGFIPFIPKGSKRIYAFGTQPNPAIGYSSKNGEQENAPIGYRYSDDDGKTWSDPVYIRPKNDPGFKGMSVMRMTESDTGSWLLGSHVSHWSGRPRVITTEQYILRSEDKGQTWELLPGKRPNGWTTKTEHRLEEGRIINLNHEGELMLMLRTQAGALFSSFSRDDGKTWTEAKPTPLVHPGAPPMVFHLSDKKTLIAFHHNRLPHKKDDIHSEGGLSPQAENMRVRSELWFSISKDFGRSWSEPRLFLATVAEPLLKVQAWNFQSSYLDLFVDGDELHLILPHRWQQVLHLVVSEKSLSSYPTKAELSKRVQAKEKLIKTSI